MRIIVDEKHLMPPLPCVIDRIRSSFHISAYEICGSFTSFSRDHVTCVPEGVTAKANDEASLSSAGRWSPEENVACEGGISYPFI